MPMALLEQDRFERMSGIIKGLPANVAIGPHLIRTPKSRFFINSRGGKFRSAGKLRLISISSASLVGHRTLLVTCLATSLRLRSVCNNTLGVANTGYGSLRNGN